MSSPHALHYNYNLELYKIDKYPFTGKFLEIQTH